jgi:hypothetical protein
MSFSKTEDRKAKQVLSGGLVPVGGERIYKKDEYGGYIMYSFIKAEK